MLPIIGVITSTVGAIAKSWLETRKVKAEGKIAVTKAKIDAKVKKIEQQGEMDIQSINDMKYSWKDEWFTVLLSLPFIACFIPPLVPFVEKGFMVLRDVTPDWYRWAFLGAIVASFGLRTWMGWKK